MEDEFDNFDRAKVGYDRMEAYDKKLWNAAIEAAAKELETTNGHYDFEMKLIRKLKK